MAHHFTKEQVVAWSRRHKNDKVIGKTNCEKNCPLVFFLRDTYGLEDVEVLTAEYNYYSVSRQKNVKRDMPIWARAVVDMVDHIRPSGNAITVGEFKNILKSVGVMS